MLNSHAKSHTNVCQFRCADCTYASKYCHSLKLHLRRHRHHPAAVLNADGSLPPPVHRRDVDHHGGPRTAPPPRRKLSFDDAGDHQGSAGDHQAGAGGGGGVHRAWSAEARLGGATGAPVTSEDNCWPPPPVVEQFPVAPPPSLSRDAAKVTSSSRDPYAFHDDPDCCSPTWSQVGDVNRRRLLPGSSNNNNNNNDNSLACKAPVCRQKDLGDAVLASVRRDDVMTDEERQLPVRKRLRNAEFVARLAANIEAELSAEDGPLDLTRTGAAAAAAAAVCARPATDADRRGKTD